MFLNYLCRKRFFYVFINAVVVKLNGPLLLLLFKTIERKHFTKLYTNLISVNVLKQIKRVLNVKTGFIYNTFPILHEIVVLFQMQLYLMPYLRLNCPHCCP